MVFLHALAAACFGPAIEFFAQLFPRFGFSHWFSSPDERMIALLLTLAMIHFLSRLNAHAQPVLGRRERARRIRVVSARRIIGLVEIEDHFAIFRRIRIEEARGRVGFLAAGQVAKDERQLSLLD